MINGKTKILGIIANPIEQVISPELFNNIFTYKKLNYSYIPFNILNNEALKDFFNSIKYMKNLIGLNVSVPYKEEASKYMDFLDEQAKNIKAVNTIRCIDNKLYGYNTDGLGYIEGLKQELNFNPYKASILILGAGGSAKSIVYNLLRENVSSIFIANRTKSKAINLAKNFKTENCNMIGLGLEELSSIDLYSIDLVINTTTVGLKKDDIPLINLDFLSKDVIISDIIMRPLYTKLIKGAIRLNKSYYTGDNMLIYQINYMNEIWEFENLQLNLIKNYFPKET